MGHIDNEKKSRSFIRNQVRHGNPKLETDWKESMEEEKKKVKFHFGFWGVPSPLV